MPLCIPCNQARTTEEMNVHYGLAKTRLSEFKDALQLVSKTTQTCKNLASKLKSDHKHLIYDEGSVIEKCYKKYLKPFNKSDAINHNTTYKCLNEIAKLCRHGENELNKITKNFTRDYRKLATGESSRRNIEAEMRDWQLFRNELVCGLRSKATQVEAHCNRYASVVSQAAKPPLRLVRSVDQLSNVSLSIR